jgi:hypothetical protein
MDFLRAYSVTFRATLSSARAFATTDREDFSLESAFCAISSCASSTAVWENYESVKGFRRLK